MVHWMIGMYGTRETKKFHDTRLDFSVEFRCIVCFNYNLIAASDRRPTHMCMGSSRTSALYFTLPLVVTDLSFFNNVLLIHLLLQRSG